MRLLSAAVLITVAFCVYAEEDYVKTAKLVHHLEISAGGDYVANSVEDDIREKIPSDEKIYVNSALPVNLKYSFSFTDPKIRQYLPGGYQGIGVGVLNFGAFEKDGTCKADKNIGYPVLAYLFQGGPFKSFRNGLSLNYEWNFGVAFGWKPWSESNQYFNLTVGSRVNAYLNLSLFLKWQIDPRAALFAGAAISHFSNGNTSFPNPGVNSLGIRIGAEWTINPVESGYPAAIPDTVKRRKPEFDISLWGASRRRVYRGGENPVLLPGHFGCAGISFAPMWSLGTWWRVGGSADIQWDGSSDMKRNYIEGTTTEDIKFTKPSFFRQVSVGLSAHGELQMPVFAVNVGCGVNLVAPQENRGTYQNITLKTYLCRQVFINIGYQLRNFHQQSSLMLGAGLTI